MPRSDLPSTHVFRHGNLRFALDAVSAFSYLSHHCHIPVINSIHVTNEGDSPLHAVTLTIDIPGYAVPASLHIEPPSPGGTCRVAPVPLELCYDRLQGLEARRYAALTVAVDGHVVCRDEILVLGFYEWSLAPDARKTLACYVQPGHAVVQQILADVREIDPAMESGVTAAGFVGAESDAASELRRIYETLQFRYNLCYTLEAPSYEADGQTIRPPHRVIPNPRTRAGAGTCIDLSLLFASCLESLHLQPLVVVIRGMQDDTHHAIVGCWRTAGERYEPVIESQQSLDQAVNRGRLIFLDAIGVTLFAGHKLSFDDAVAAASRRLAEGELAFALDVAAARHTVVPLEFPMSPAALSILAAAQTIARNAHGQTLETRHLLAAAMSQAGPRVGAFLSAAGLRTLDPPNDAVVPCSGSAPPRATLNYRRCIDDARTIAGDCGAGFVEEEHLLYALLLSSSRRVDRELEALGVDRGEVLRAFRKHFLWTRDLVSTEHGLEMEARRPSPGGKSDPV